MLDCDRGVISRTAAIMTCFARETSWGVLSSNHLNFRRGLMTIGWYSPFTVNTALYLIVIGVNTYRLLEYKLGLCQPTSDILLAYLILAGWDLLTLGHWLASLTKFVSFAHKLAERYRESEFSLWTYNDLQFAWKQAAVFHSSVRKS